MTGCPPARARIGGGPSPLPHSSPNGERCSPMGEGKASRASRKRSGSASLVGVVLGAGESAALEAVADRIVGQLGLRRQRFGAEILGLVPGPVAELVGVRVVPPRGGVVGGAVEDLVF